MPVGADWYFGERRGLVDGIATAARGRSGRGAGAGPGPRLPPSVLVRGRMSLSGTPLLLCRGTTARADTPASMRRTRPRLLSEQLPFPERR
ncbi:hypothetical protein [Streptomyces sp. WMMB303]|uniref:hypothetical protein n=1 Tax=Streptomyces sp. WMMB303 TaxID=3034154 RepID=UPI0023EC7195|nr:hypothetical protein [Streptomyces sp. WMMB303]MDF4252160.1 hypothetical protein [Streptomyces sp. WMMB303]